MNSKIIRHVLKCYEHASVERRAAAFFLLAESIAETLDNAPEELLATEMFDDLCDFCQTFGIPVEIPENNEVV